MGAQLDRIFRIVEEKSGFRGRMRLVVKTGVTRVVAASIPDDPPLVERFQAAASDVLGYDIRILPKEN